MEGVTLFKNEVKQPINTLIKAVALAPTSTILS